MGKVPLDKAAPQQAVAGPPAVRASDADRDRIADILREALAEGRIDAEEHAERIDAVYRAKTLAELEPLIGDLPAGQRYAAPAASPAVGVGPRSAGVRAAGHGIQVAGAKNVVAVLSGANRQGRWRVGAKINAVAVCGGVELDLTEAIFEQQQVVINATAICGGIEIKVPENVTLRSAGSGVMGGFDVREIESTEPGAPVITVQGVAIWGGVDAKVVRGKRIRDLRDA
ncbi:DUF1707 domain-containing protein [Streptomyces sp. 8K308]|uniref:DUF1707 SHOCT-like domain-containing protein n=1 Tax=Streptomyces sp. 8K308 TaxID=2530388 RepID=UPI001A9D30CA|nr:DUF1707 domain-containing protein [Streptomyces sp. 8K308]